MSSRPSTDAYTKIVSALKQIRRESNLQITENTGEAYQLAMSNLTNLSNKDKVEILQFLYYGFSQQNNMGELFNALKFNNLEKETHRDVLRELSNLNNLFANLQNNNLGFLNNDLNTHFKQILESPETHSDNIPMPISQDYPYASPPRKPTNAEFPTKPPVVSAEYQNPIVAIIAEKLGNNTYKNVSKERALYTNRVFSENRVGENSLSLEKYGKIELGLMRKLQNQLISKSPIFDQELSKSIFDIFKAAEKSIFDKDFDKLLITKGVGLTPAELDQIKRETIVGYFLKLSAELFPITNGSPDYEKNVQLNDILKSVTGEYSRANFSNSDDMFNKISAKYLTKLTAVIDSAFKETVTTSNSKVLGILKNSNYKFLGDRGTQVLQDKINLLTISDNKIELQAEFNKQILGSDTQKIKLANQILQEDISNMQPSTQRIQLQMQFNQIILGKDSSEAQKAGQKLQEDISNMQPATQRIQLQSEFNQIFLGKNSSEAQKANQNVQKDISNMQLTQRIQLQNTFNQIILGKASPAADEVNQKLQKNISDMHLSVNKINLQQQFNQQILDNDYRKTEQANKKLQDEISNATLNEDKIKLQKEFNQQMLGNDARKAMPGIQKLLNEINGLPDTSAINFLNEVQPVINNLAISIEKIQLQKELNQKLEASPEVLKTLQNEIRELPANLNKVQLQHEYNKQLMGANSRVDRIISALSSVWEVAAERVTGKKSSTESSSNSSSKNANDQASEVPSAQKNQGGFFSTIKRFITPNFINNKTDITNTNTDNLKASVQQPLSSSSQIVAATSNSSNANNSRKKASPRDNIDLKFDSSFITLINNKNKMALEIIADIIETQSAIPAVYNTPLTDLNTLMKDLKSYKETYKAENQQNLINAAFKNIENCISAQLKIVPESSNLYDALKQAQKDVLTAQGIKAKPELTNTVGGLSRNDTREPTRQNFARKGF